MTKKAVICWAAIWAGSSLSCGEPHVVTDRGGVDPGRSSGGGPADSGVPGFSLPDAGGAGSDTPSAPGSSTMGPIEDCETAAKAAGNVGCTFYSVPFAFGYDLLSHPGYCHAMFVVNPGRQPVKLRLDKGGVAISLGPLARLPRGGGLTLELLPYDEAAGLAGGDVAILFLRAGGVDPNYQDRACPQGVTPAERGLFAEEAKASFTGKAFRLVADRPVAAYQIFPYGGAGSQITSATLLLPTESWGREHYVAAPEDATGSTFAAVIAKEDGTDVLLRTTANIRPLPGMPATKRGAQLRMTLDAGELLWVATPVGLDLSPKKSLSASLVVASKPVAVFGGSESTFSPPAPPLLTRIAPFADSIQQQVPPISALGHEYAAVRHRSRLPNQEEPAAWQLMGIADGTTLSYSPSQPEGAPTSLAAAQVVQFSTREPFVVRSQDADHPFYLGAFMTAGTSNQDWAGDPDFVNVLPVAQYQSAYVFFTDPTYPETSLVVVRQKGAERQFADVKLDCAAAPISGWRPVGELEYTWVDLVTGAYQPAIPGCGTGRREMTSTAPFGVTVWGWGSRRVLGPNPRMPGEQTSTQATSYGFPAGGAVRPINRVRPTVE